MRRFHTTAFLFLTLAALASGAAANPFFVTGKLGNTALVAVLSGWLARFLDGADTTWFRGLGLRVGD